MDNATRQKAQALMLGISGTAHECYDIESDLADLKALRVSKHTGPIVDLVLEARAMLLGFIKQLENEVNEAADDSHTCDPAPRSFLGREV